VSGRAATDRSTLRERLAGLSAAGTELLDREFAPSTGHLAAFLSGCVFAPSLLTFWFVNGVLDFSTAVLIGAVTPDGVVVRLVAYLLLVPTFLALRVAYYLLHPVHRRTVLSGSCPTATLLSLDWFSVGILATGLPLAVQAVGPWVGMNAVYAVGLFVVPRLVPSEWVADRSRVLALLVGTAVFGYARYGALLTPLGLPHPATVLGPVATARLTDATTATLLAVTNSLLTGPVVVAGLALATNLLLTRPELTSVPYLRHALPRRDPAPIVLASAAFGTMFYLGVVGLWTGSVSVLP
jgi:hypothetical protein